MSARKRTKAKKKNAKVGKATAERPKVKEKAYFSGAERRELARFGRSMRAFVEEMRPAMLKGVTVPSRSDVEQAVDEAIATLPGLLARAGRRAMHAGEELDLREQVVIDVHRFVTTPELHADVAIANHALVPIMARGSGGTLALMANGQLAATFNLADITARDAAVAVMIVDILLEIIGLILGLLGLRFPAPDARVMTGPLLEVMKTDGFKEAMKKLLRGFIIGDALAIMQGLNMLRTLGVLGELVTGYFANLSTVDYLKAMARFLAFLALTLGTAGGGTLIKAAAVLLNAIEIATKAQQLAKM